MKINLIILMTTFLFSCGQSDRSSIKNTTSKSTSNNQKSTEKNEADVIKFDSINQYWYNKKITSATLYCYLPEAGQSSEHYILDKNNKLNATIIDSLTYELPSSLTNSLSNAIVRATSYIEEKKYDCFQPHHGIVMKNDQGEIVGHISICFECNRYELFPQHVSYIPIDFFKYICRKAKVPTEKIKLMDIFHKSKKNNSQKNK
jgi:hypothetical protein